MADARYRRGRPRRRPPRNDHRLLPGPRRDVGRRVRARRPTRRRRGHGEGPAARVPDEPLLTLDTVLRSSRVPRLRPRTTRGCGTSSPRATRRWSSTTAPRSSATPRTASSTPRPAARALADENIARTYEQIRASRAATPTRTCGCTTLRALLEAGIRARTGSARRRRGAPDALEELRRRSGRSASSPSTSS